MDCKYVAVEAVTALVTVFQTLQQAAPKGDPRVRSWWAKLLLHPNMARIEEACDLLEQAAAGVLSAPPGSRFPSPQGMPSTLHCCTAMLLAPSRDARLGMDGASDTLMANAAPAHVLMVWITALQEAVCNRAMLLPISNVPVPPAHACALQ